MPSIQHGQSTHRRLYRFARAATNQNTIVHEDIEVWFELATVIIQNVRTKDAHAFDYEDHREASHIAHLVLCGHDLTGLNHLKSYHPEKYCSQLGLEQSRALQNGTSLKYYLRYLNVNPIRRDYARCLNIDTIRRDYAP